MRMRGDGRYGELRRVVFGIRPKEGKFHNLQNAERRDLETKRTKEIQKMFLFCS